MKWIKRFIGIGILIFGLLLLLYPDMNDVYISYNSNKAIKEFETQKESSKEDTLLEMVKQYNRTIFNEGQANLNKENQMKNPLKDYFSDDLYGTITIKRMDIKVPLYIGTSDEHLTGGAAIMGETSFPLNQSNTNSVICAHRGWYGHPFFRDIELLKKGDKVQIDTKFENLEYKVRDIKVISPFDDESIKIQENSKMITLSTCHPYGYSSLSNRYIVYCDLIEEPEEDVLKEDEEIIEETITVPGKSQNQILFETWGRRLLITLVVLLIIFCVF